MMGDVRKILGQCAPPASTDVPLYSCPTSAVVSTIFVCNRAAANTFSLWARRGGETTSNRQFLYYGAPAPANDTLAITAGITLAAGDDLYVSGGAASQLSFSAFGVEASA